MSSSTSNSDASRADASRTRVLRASAGIAVAILLGLVLLALGPGREALVAAGAEGLKPRDRLLREASRERLQVPLAVFLGDSTFRPPRSYPVIIKRSLAPQAELRMLWAPGLGPAEHYLLLGRALDLEPEVVVILAHFRLMVGDGPLWYPDLLTLLPLRELPHALVLPFHAREVGAARLILASAFGALPTGDLLHAFVGGHELARKAPLLRWLTPVRPRTSAPEPPADERERRVAGYGERLYPGHPALEMIEASVELAERRGARVLVLVSPVPVMRLLEAGVYHAAAFEDRVAQVREATLRSRGELLDLHDALAPAHFSDGLGHYTASGAALVAARVERWLRPVLGIRESTGR